MVVFSQAQCIERGDPLPALTTHCRPTNPATCNLQFSMHPCDLAGTLPSLPSMPLVLMVSWNVPFYHLLCAPPGSNPYHKGVCTQARLSCFRQHRHQPRMAWGTVKQALITECVSGLMVLSRDSVLNVSRHWLPSLYSVSLTDLKF